MRPTLDGMVQCGEVSLYRLRRDNSAEIFVISFSFFEFKSLQLSFLFLLLCLAFKGGEGSIVS